VSVRGLKLSLNLLGGVLVLATAACGGSVQGQPNVTSTQSAASPAGGVLAAVDPCKLLMPQELQQLGLPAQGQPADTSGETGCSYTKYPLAITMAKANNGLSYFTEHPDHYTDLGQNSVNSRPGVHFRVSQSTGDCSQAMSVGAGYVVVGVVSNAGGDACGKALQIAQMVEPRLAK
jgi:hypothetical protein